MIDRDTLPIPDPAFAGRIGSTYANSSPDFPAGVAPPRDAPNVVLILLDDVGFGQPSTFGGPVELAALDRLAQRGLRYNRFHTTALCTPTRAALLTGRNHHVSGFGAITNIATGFPGYNGVWPRNTACVAEVLRGNGFATAAFGKWHNTPEWEMSPAGPFDRWPNRLGFDHWYGFMGADSNQWDPQLFVNTACHVRPESRRGVHLDEDLADRAIDWIRLQRAVDPQRPFFLYYAPGTAHSPHHAPVDWLLRYRGRFEHGWDAEREATFRRQLASGVIPGDAMLTPRPAEIPPWADFSVDERKVAARLMEAFAAALSHCDHQVGRVIGELETQGIADNALVIYVAGDNGPSAEGTLRGAVNKWAVLNGMPETTEQQLAQLDLIGGPHTYSNYPVGWAWAGSAPMQWVKQIASHFGGTRNGMVISWPERIGDRGALREQFHHCIDVVPTILDAVGLQAPSSVNGVTQGAIDGVSMKYTFDAKDAASRRRTQYFEMMGNRAIYHDGWVAGARHRGPLPWQSEGSAAPGDFESDPWELYEVSADFSQARDLAALRPDKLAELRTLWQGEAERSQVFPLDDRYTERFHQGPATARDKTQFSFQPGVFRIPESCAPNLKGRSHRIIADISLNAQGTSGMIVTAGGRFGGYALYLREGRAYYVHNLCGLERYTVASPAPLGIGRGTLTLTFTTEINKPGSGGRAVLSDATGVLAEVRIPRTVPFLYSYTETFDIGLDTGSPVDETYSCPFEFGGEIHSVRIEVLDELAEQDRIAEAAAVEHARRDND